MSEIAFHTRNITRYFRSLDPAVIAEGREWYPRARAFAEELAADWAGETGADEAAITRAAAVIAVLSPREHWSKNVEHAKRVYAAQAAYDNGADLAIEHAIETWKGLKINARKAFRILAGEEPNDVVKGPKVRQFWHTIVDPADPRAVVVDRHAWAVAAGRVLTDTELGQYSGRLGAYDDVSEMYRRAAAILSKWLGYTITPAEVQAITWTAWRREHSAKAKSNRKIETGEA